MITIKLAESIKAYLAKTGVLIDIYTPLDSDNRNHPNVSIAEITPSEHELLDGVYETSFEVVYISNPNDDEDAGDTTATIKTQSENVWKALTCENLIDILNLHPGIKYFDIYVSTPRSEERDGRAAVVYSMECVCCEI